MLAIGHNPACSVPRMCTHRAGNMQIAGGYEDPSPVFVVGMPRSGSTLVESILASHSQVWGAGEDT